MQSTELAKSKLIGGRYIIDLRGTTCGELSTVWIKETKGIEILSTLGKFSNIKEFAKMARDFPDIIIKAISFDYNNKYRWENLLDDFASFVRFVPVFPDDDELEACQLVAWDLLKELSKAGF